MREIRTEKVTLNVGAGEAGDKLNNAIKLLENITGAKAVKTRTMKRIPSWGLRPKLTIGAKVSIRGKKAEELVSRLLHAVDNNISKRKFDNQGNFSFGIDEYILIPGVAYDVGIGVIGLDVAVTLCRKGYRIKRRRVKRKIIPMRHRINKEEAIEFMKLRYGIKVGEE